METTSTRSLFLTKYSCNTGRTKKRSSLRVTTMWHYNKPDKNTYIVGNKWLLIQDVQLQYVYSTRPKSLFEFISLVYSCTVRVLRLSSFQSYSRWKTEREITKIRNNMSMYINIIDNLPNVAHCIKKCCSNDKCVTEKRSWTTYKMNKWLQ